MLQPEIQKKKHVHQWFGTPGSETFSGRNPLNVQHKETGTNEQQEKSKTGNYQCQQLASWVVI